MGLCWNLLSDGTDSRKAFGKLEFRDTNIKVRNIENVQGDEFDQVICLWGTPPNREEKPLITNFWFC